MYKLATQLPRKDTSCSTIRPPLATAPSLDLLGRTTQLALRRSLDQSLPPRKQNSKLPLQLQKRHRASHKLLHLGESLVLGRIDDDVWRLRSSQAISSLCCLNSKTTLQMGSNMDATKLKLDQAVLTDLMRHKTSMPSNTVTHFCDTDTSQTSTCAVLVIFSNFGCCFPIR